MPFPVRLAMWLDTFGMIRARERRHDETVRRLNAVLAENARLRARLEVGL